ncbi:MAG: ribosome maturation factor RimM [Burkholderiales bacterium]|nr:ribosome maturation factor RimM [Burkholderiales bacterium]
MAALLPDDLIELGQVQDAQGLQGEIKVRPFSSDPVALLASKSVWLSLRPHLATDAVGTKLPNSVFAPQEYRVIKAKYHSGLVVLHLEGVTDRDAALTLKGGRILVSRTAFPKPADDSYYWVDLIACRVINLQGDDLGEVNAITDNAAHPILSVGKKPMLIPFVPEIIKNVNLSSRTIELDWQADW